MGFEESLSEGFIKEISPDNFKAESLFNSANDALYSINKLPLEEHTLKTILRELYEGLRQVCEAIGYLDGYKFRSHESIVYFIDEKLNLPIIAAKFERYRKLRNRINYYGGDVSEETVKTALDEIPQIISELKETLQKT